MSHAPSRRRRRVPALAFLGAAAVLVPAGTAQAAFISAISGTTVSLVGSDSVETLTVGAAGGLLSHNLTDPGFTSAFDWDTTAAGDQTAPADDTITIAVSSLGGNDTINFSGADDVLAALVDAGAGDDLVFGSIKADTLGGGDGDDRIVPGQAGDTAAGGAGNDTLVWNNGDGSDVMEGDAGADTIEVNGAPTVGDQFTIKPGAVAGRVRFDRTNLGPFNLDIGTSERMEINGLGGDDAMAADPGLAALILLTLNGGTGADTLAGGDGPDLIQGGDGVDTLGGGAGDDRVIGNRGNDVMSGGDGDDTLVWNNGDGTDRADGDGGYDTMEVNGAPTAGDAFTVRPDGVRTRFDRTNLGPFSIDLATEALDLNTLGGDDTLGVTAGTVVSIDADGGAGNDTLTGADGNDGLTGGSGNDAITGGAGLDLLAGGDGDDVISARDDVADLILCGAGGADRAVMDMAATDHQVGCETVDQTPTPPAAVAGGVTVLTRRAAISRGRALIVVRCPVRATAGCRGELTLQTWTPVRIGALRAPLVLGSARYSLVAGATATLRVRLAANYTALVPTRAQTLLVRAQATNAGGQITSRRVTLVLPRVR